MNVGVDEAGRGCIYGPVSAGAVIWDDRITHEYLRDSKTLSKRQKAIMYDFVLEHAIDYGVALVHADVIDSHNILQATQSAMHSALDSLSLDFDLIQVDGNFFKPYKVHAHECIIKGDSKVKSIAAASILAKVTHDNWILDHIVNDSEEDQYSLRSNMGYCTKKHVIAVRNFGQHLHHRKTFKLPMNT